MSRSLWTTIFLLRQAREPLAGWKHYLREAFDAVRPLLVPCVGVAGKSIPCPNSGVRLQIRENNGVYVAIPTGQAAEDVEDVVLAWDDVQAWRLDQGALQRSLSQAFGLTGEPSLVDGTDIAFLGYCERGGCRKRVYLCHAAGAETAVRAAADTGGTIQAGCLVYAERHDAVEHVLTARGVALVSLAECMTIVGDGVVTGRCAGACGTARPNGGKQDERNSGWAFVDEGASYRVVMPEGEFTMPKKVGETYLHWFARNPRKECRVLDLVSQVRSMGGKKVMANWDEEQDQHVGMATDGDDVDGVTTRKTLGELRERLRQIKSERDRAENEGDMDRVGKLDDEVEAIQRLIEKDTNRFGKIRKVANDDTKAAASIIRQLNRVYERLRKVKKQEPARKAFVDHFKERLTIGYMCKYEVPKERDWRVFGK